MFQYCKFRLSNLTLIHFPRLSKGKSYRMNTQLFQNYCSFLSFKLHVLHLSKEVLYRSLLRPFLPIRSQLSFVPKFWSQRRKCRIDKRRTFGAAVECYNDCDIATWKSIFLFEKISTVWHITAFLTCMPFAQVLRSTASPLYSIIMIPCRILASGGSVPLWAICD